MGFSIYWSQYVTWTVLVHQCGIHDDDDDGQLCGSRWAKFSASLSTHRWVTITFSSILYACSTIIHGLSYITLYCCSFLSPKYSVKNDAFRALILYKYAWTTRGWNRSRNDILIHRGYLLCNEKPLPQGMNRFLGQCEQSGVIKHGFVLRQ